MFIILLIYISLSSVDMYIYYVTVPVQCLVHLPFTPNLGSIKYIDLPIYLPDH